MVDRLRKKRREHKRKRKKEKKTYIGKKESVNGMANLTKFFRENEKRLNQTFFC
jgi:hypothetical protein